MEYKSSEQILNDLRQGSYRPVYILHGEESFFIDQISDYIEANALTDGEKAFNQMVLYGKDIICRQIYDEARQYPMMSQRRVVIIKEAQDLKDLKELSNYISAPADHTVLVIAHKNKKVDGRISWLKEAKKAPNVVVLASTPVRDYQLGAWVKGYLQSRKRSITNDANQLLCEYLGTDLKKLVNEISKMELNLPADKTIDASDIEKYVGISKEYNVFELTKALSAKDNRRAHAICDNLCQNMHKSPIQMMIPAISNHFQKAHIIKRIGNKSDQQLAQMIGVSPYAIKDSKLAARNYSEPGLRSILYLLKEADGKSKGVNQRKAQPETILFDIVSQTLQTK